MAMPLSLLSPGAEGATKVDVAGTASSAEIVLGINRLISITATGIVHVKWGNAGMGAASVADYPIGAYGHMQTDMGHTFDRLRVYNPAGGQISFYILPLARS